MTAARAAWRRYLRALGLVLTVAFFAAAVLLIGLWLGDRDAAARDGAVRAPAERAS